MASRIRENVDEHSSWKVMAELPERRESQRLNPNSYVLTLPKSLADPSTSKHREDSQKPGLKIKRTKLRFQLLPTKGETEFEV